MARRYYKKPDPIVALFGLFFLGIYGIFKLMFLPFILLLKGAKVIWQPNSIYSSSLEKKTIGYLSISSQSINQLSKFDFEQMSGQEFEVFIMGVLIRNGFKNVDGTPVSGDYGVDILAVKDGQKYAIQCKRWNGNVGIGAVQEVFSGRFHYKCDRAMVITNSRFTDAAKNLAVSNNVELIDREKLLQMMSGTGFTSKGNSSQMTNNSSNIFDQPMWSKTLRIDHASIVINETKLVVGKDGKEVIVEFRDLYKLALMKPYIKDVNLVQNCEIKLNCRSSVDSSIDPGVHLLLILSVPREQYDVAKNVCYDISFKAKTVIIYE